MAGGWSPWERTECPIRDTAGLPAASFSGRALTGAASSHCSLPTGTTTARKSRRTRRRPGLTGTSGWRRPGGTPRRTTCSSSTAATISRCSGICQRPWRRPGGCIRSWSSSSLIWSAAPRGCWTAARRWRRSPASWPVRRRRETIPCATRRPPVRR